MPDFLSQMYVLFLTVNIKQDNKDKILSKQKNKIFIFEWKKDKTYIKCSKSLYWLYWLAKLHSYLCKNYYWKYMFQDLKAILD